MVEPADLQGIVDLERRHEPPFAALPVAHVLPHENDVQGLDAVEGAVARLGAATTRAPRGLGISSDGNGGLVIEKSMTFERVDP